MQVKKQQLEPCMEQLIGSGLRKESFLSRQSSGILSQQTTGCLLSSCLFNPYTEPIMRNAGLDDLQAAIKNGGRNINNLR